MTDSNKKSSSIRTRIIELGYRAKDKLDTSRPPKGGSGVREKIIRKHKEDKQTD